jgi:hypothetical protein
MTAIDPTAVYTRKQVAALTQLSERRIADDPNLPVLKWGYRTVRYFGADVLAWVEQFRRAA